MLRRVLQGLALVVVACGLAVLSSGLGWFGTHEGPGRITESERPPAEVAAQAQAQQSAAQAIGKLESKQILFGDLHVHTTISTDAFMLSLPLAQGEGTRPQADACDFARFCSALDFWSINDHAEAITPTRWSETIDSIRQCNAVTGSDAAPDTVAFLGWEWTQVGLTPETHYGHKNVVLKGTDDGEIPARPIASRGLASSALSGPGVVARGLFALATGSSRVHDYALYMTERSRVDDCPDEVHVRELPADCIESTRTPGELFRKLDEWDIESVVIPHGSSWGLYTPQGSSWDKQLTPEQHDPERQTLVEIFSGHGNSEEYRDWRAVELDDAGGVSCPAPSSGYTPACWRAGEIIRQRCLEEGSGEPECEARAAEARQLSSEAGIAGHHVVQGETPDEWLDAGQCTDCYLPPLNHRPLSSVQYMMALGNFQDPVNPMRFRFGFMGSSDNHFARPGTGYKEIHRRGMSESRSIPRDNPLAPPPEEPLSRPVPFDPDDTELAGFQLVEIERQASFFLTGGLIAAHSSGRDRDSIWSSMQRREVYATSGPRILLWFDLMNPPSGDAPLPMGGAVEMNETPRFQVRAVGSFEQRPGCPDDRAQALGPERLASLCKGECYHPSDERRPITRIEVVRIRPQQRAGEDVGPLIEDPWRVFTCNREPAGCAVVFEDPEFGAGARDVLYYARAIESPSPAINADNVRCERDEAGRCTGTELCGVADPDEECLGETEERAWSSPIFVDWAGARPAS